MKRRVVLSGLVAGLGSLAGCQGLYETATAGRRRRTFDVPPRTDTERSDLPRGTRLRTDPTPPAPLKRSIRTDLAPSRRLALAGWSSDLADGIGVTAGFVDTVSRQSPARVWVALENRRSEPTEVEVGRTPPLSQYVGLPDFSSGLDPDDGRVALIPADERPSSGIVPTSPAGNGHCWGGERRGTPPSESDPTVVELGPRAAVIGEYFLLWMSEEPGCLPTSGGFDFENDRVGFGLRVGVWHPAVARPDASRFDRSVPDLPDDDETVWFHQADAETPVYLSPSNERLAGATAELAVELQNFSPGWIRANAGDWHLYKLHDGEWKSIAPWIALAAPHAVGPAGRATLGFSVTRESVGPVVSAATRPIGGLGPGLYALAFGHGPASSRDARPVRVGGGSDPIAGSRRRFAALFYRTGDAPELTGWSVGRGWRNGRTVTLQVGRGATPNSPSLVVRREPSNDREESRTDDGGSSVSRPVELITEQVYQAPILRNALVAFRSIDDVDRVRLQSGQFAPGASIDRFGPDRSRAWFAFTYEGTRYVAALQN